MRGTSRVIFLTLVAITLSELAIGVRLALAQSATDDVQLIQASKVYKYARYYAPYAIQAAAAYLSIKELDDRHLKQDDNGYGADVNYAVRNVFGGEVKSAQEAVKAWQYQFGSDSYLTCIDPTDSDCQDALRNKGWSFGSGPSFQVWARTRFPHANSEACTEVSIAFRGTVGLGWDWLSNADRFGSPYDDYYHQLRRNIDGIIHQIKGLDCYRRARRKPQIVSTGHSLGGGLAQLAALANKPSGVRITKVFAFDPSPVTGARLVDKQLRAANAAGLTIDRIYQEGEVLSYPREFVQEYPPAKSACNPFVRTVKVDAVSSRSAVGLHGMNPLAVQMVQLSYDGDTPLTYRPPNSPANCAIRYRSPNEEGALVASARGRPALFAFVRNNRRYAARTGAANPVATRQDGSAPKPGLLIQRVMMLTGGHRIRKSRITHAPDRAAVERTSS